MTKAAIIISAILVFAGVAAAGSLPGLSGGGSNSPALDTPSLATTTVEDDGQVGEDISGPCDEAEHANDPRCTGTQADDDDRHGRNRGPGGDDDDSGDDHGGNSGRSGSSGHGGGGGDD